MLDPPERVEPYAGMLGERTHDDGFAAFSVGVA
jgi:hypothetical protein